MATQQDLKARLIVEAATEGDGEIEALASELESLAREGGGAAPKLQALAASLREMGQQDQAVSHFAALRRQTADTATAMDAASATVDRLAQELEQASGAARQAASAQADAARSVQQARERQAQLKDAIAQTNAELKAARAAYREGGGDSEQYARQIGEGAAQLKVLKAEQKQAAAEVRALANAQRDAAAQSRAAAQTQQAVASEYERAVKSASQLSGTLREQNQALAQARQALDSAGLSTQGLSDQQAELRASLVQAERQAADYVEVVRQMRAESGALGPALQATFKQLGMRGVAQITAEIEQLQAAMRGLKGQKLLPEDASRLTTELQRRIESLRGEMKGAQGEARGAADAVGQLGDRSRTAGSQIGAAAHKALAWTSALVGLNQLRQVASNVLETGSAFEQLDRRLTGILGSAEKAGHAMAMIKQLAQDTPFDVQGLTDTYAKLSAFGLQPTREQMLAIIDTAAKLGGGTEALTGVSLALGQAWTKQKLQGEEILQLAERGVPVWDLLAKATGRNVQELQKMSEAGQLGRDVIVQLIDAMGRQNAGASADLMASLAGAVQRAQDAMQDFLNTIAQSGVLDYLTQQLQGLLAEFDRMKASGELDAWAKRIATGFIDVANTAQGVVAVVRQLAPVIEVAAKAFVALRLAQFAGGLTGVAAAGGQAAGALKLLGAASLPAKLGLTGVSLAAIQLGMELLTIARNYGAYRAELAKHEALNAQVAAKQEQVAAKLKGISDATGVVVTSLQELEDAQASGALVFDEAVGRWLSAEQVQRQLAGALQATAAEMAAVNASRIVAEFSAANAASGETEKAIDQLAESLQFKDVQGASAFVLAMEQIGNTGALTARQVEEAWQKALGKLSAGELGALRANLEEAARTGVISAQQLAQANAQILGASFARLGVNAAQALGQISEGAQDAIDSVHLVAEASESAGASVEQSARAIEMAFGAAIPRADSLEAIAELEKQLKALGAAGKISAEGVQRTQAALDRQRATIEDQLPGIQSLGEALRQLGVKPQAELKALADAARQAFDKVKSSGTATTREINQAWKAMAEAAIAANDGVADAALKSQAAQHGFAVTTDESGKSVVESMKKAEEATKAVGAAAQAAAGQMGGMADAAWKAGEDLVAQARAHNAALGELRGTWLDATAAASRYAAEMAKLVFEAGKNTAVMRAEHAELVRQMEALERQQKRLQDQGGGAARGVEDLRLRLLELSGTEDQIARARHERDVAEVRRQRALQELELQRALLRQDGAEADRLRQEIALLGEQLALLDKVFAEEEKQRKAREKSRGGSGGSDGGGSSGGKGGGAAAPPVNITLNANGVNDPQRLARLIEPELKKLARLAR